MFYTTRKKESRFNKIIELKRNIYDAMRSKNSTSSPRTGASVATVLGTEVLDEVSSLTRFLFLSTPMFSESVGGGDVVELVSSSDSSTSSPSYFSSASWASDTVEARSAGRGPSERMRCRLEGG
jgi:hypothetical protein